MDLYAELGGASGIEAAVEDFYARVLADPTLAPWFVDLDMARLKAHQESFLAVALGGPEEYAGRSMRVAHQGLRISSADFDQILFHLTHTLADGGVAQPAIDSVAKSIGALRAAIVEAY
jgi:hemoglobin